MNMIARLTVPRRTQLRAASRMHASMHVSSAITPIPTSPLIKQILPNIAAKPKASAPGAKKFTVAINKLLVNVAGTMGSRYLLVSMSVVSTDPAFQQTLTDNDAALRDAASSVLAAKTLADLEKTDERNLIRTELLTGFNHILGSDEVQEIYLTEFAIQ